MITFNVLSMTEYKPVNGDTVDLYLCDRSWTPVVGINLVEARCEITYQCYDASDRLPVSSWTSHTDEMMEKIPFNTPFVHISVPIENSEMMSIVDFRLLEEHEFEPMKEKAQLEQFYRTVERDLEKDHPDYAKIMQEKANDLAPYVDIASSYWEKRWYFVINSNHQIHDTDDNNEVLGIIDKDHLQRELFDKQEGASDE